MTLTKLLSAAGLALAIATPAGAQPNQEWFTPGQQQPPQRPPAGGRAPPPAAAQQQPPAGQAAPAAQPPAAARPPAAAARAGAPLAPGQPPPNAVIGIVDVPEIQRVSSAFNQVREEIEKRRNRLNEDLQREQNSWRDAQQQLANQRSTLAPDDVRGRERALQDRITDSQRIFRERSRAIEQAAQQALVEIEQGLGNVIRQVAASHQVNLVLPRALVIFNDAPFDLTPAVAQQFNRTLRSVTLPPDTRATGAAPRPAAPAPAAPAAAAARKRCN